MSKWTDEVLAEQNAMKLRKFKCPKCHDVNPIMELINTISCLNCHESYVELVEGGYVIISKEDWSIIEMSEETM